MNECSTLITIIKKNSIVDICEWINLNCDCNYECHYVCFNQWYHIKQECIICHKPTYGKPNWRKLRKRKIRRRRTPPRRGLTITEIERRLELLPDDNENERKTLQVVFFLMVVIWIVYNYLK